MDPEQMDQLYQEARLLLRNGMNRAHVDQYISAQTNGKIPTLDRLIKFWN